MQVLNFDIPLHLEVGAKNENQKLEAMKTMNFNAAAVAMVSLLTVGCANVEDCTPAAEAQSQQLVLTAAISSGSKASAASAVKDSWNAGEKILVSNATEQANFYASSTGSFVEFISKSSDSRKFNSKVFGIYPASSGEFSLEGQNGTLSGVEKFSLMTGEGTVSNAKANLNFQSKVAVICLHNISVDKMEGAILNKVELTGAGISSKVSVNISANGVSLQAGEESAVEVAGANFGADVFVVFFPTAETKSIQVTLRDTRGGEFFTTISNNGAALQAGMTYEVNGSTVFEGGYPISFNPSVNDWVTAGC